MSELIDPEEFLRITFWLTLSIPSNDNHRRQSRWKLPNSIVPKCHIYLKYFLFRNVTKKVKVNNKVSKCVSRVQRKLLESPFLDPSWSFELIFEIFVNCFDFVLFNQTRYYFLFLWNASITSCERKLFSQPASVEIALLDANRLISSQCFRVFLFCVLSSFVRKQSVFANSKTNSRSSDNRLSSFQSPLFADELRNAFLAQLKCIYDSSAAIFRDDLTSLNPLQQRP